MERNDLIKLLIIHLISRKKVVDSSYFFHNLFTRLGIFVSPEELIVSCKEEKLLEFEDYFGSSGLIKNIRLGINGQKLINVMPIENYLDEMEDSFDNFTFIKSIMLQKLD